MAKHDVKLMQIFKRYLNKPGDEVVIAGSAASVGSLMKQKVVLRAQYHDEDAESAPYRIDKAIEWAERNQCVVLERKRRIMNDGSESAELVVDVKAISNAARNAVVQKALNATGDKSKQKDWNVGRGTKGVYTAVRFHMPFDMNTWGPWYRGYFKPDRGQADTDKVRHFYDEASRERFIRDENRKNGFVVKGGEYVLSGYVPKTSWNADTSVLRETAVNGAGYVDASTVVIRPGDAVVFKTGYRSHSNDDDWLERNGDTVREVRGDEVKIGPSANDWAKIKDLMVWHNSRTTNAVVAKALNASRVARNGRDALGMLTVGTKVKYGSGKTGEIVKVKKIYSHGFVEPEYTVKGSDGRTFIENEGRFEVVD